MSAAGGYPIEEFLEAITAQLDQTQDALRLKAVNRPLTFALKDFNVDLKVFVEMDTEGRVVFRPAAPNEEGASTVSIGFTTITRPAIEENTISMEMANAPTLDELGLAAEERRQLARIGVRNAAQLRNLERNAGDEGMARHTGVNLGRIRGALDLARPRLSDVIDPDDIPAPPSAPPLPDAPDVTPAPSAAIPDNPPATAQPPQVTIPLEPPTLSPQQEPRPSQQPPFGEPVVRDPRQAVFQPGAQPLKPEAPNLNLDMLRPGINNPAPQHPVATPKPRQRIKVGPDARKIDLRGANLIDGGRIPVAKLDGQRLQLLSAQPSALSFALPQGWSRGPGRLSVEMPDGEQSEYDLSGGAGA